MKISLLPDKMKHVSRLQKDTIRPVFGDVFQFDIPDDVNIETRSLKFTLYDQEKLNKRVLGKATFSLKKTMPQSERWISLSVLQVNRMCDLIRFDLLRIRSLCLTSILFHLRFLLFASFFRWMLENFNQFRRRRCCNKLLSDNVLSRMIQGCIPVFRVKSGPTAKSLFSLNRMTLCSFAHCFPFAKFRAIYLSTSSWPLTSTTSPTRKCVPVRSRLLQGS